MSNKYLKLFSAALICLFFAGCAAKTPAPISRQVANTEGFVQKTDNFVVVLDASSSMVERIEGTSKFDLAKDLVKMLNGSIPNIPLNGALRTFGHDKRISTDTTKLFYGITGYDKEAFATGIDAVTRAGGFSPMGTAITGAAGDLEKVQGHSAVIIFSDGVDPSGGPLAAAQAMKDMYGQNVCIYTVAVGSNPEGKELMQGLVDIGECGMAVEGKDLRAAGGMAEFVRNVFFKKAPVVREMDSDGDGIIDRLDQCPGTPAGTPVDNVGCPLNTDTDLDGVMDDQDLCPNSPKGARVDAKGCWNIPSALFDFDSDRIKSDAKPLLDNVADVMMQNGDLTMIVNGHTCTIGSKAYNQKLSERRAIAVINYITSKGISRSRFSYKGFNFSQPAASNDTREGRALNRRADVVPVK